MRKCLAILLSAGVLFAGYTFSVTGPAQDRHLALAQDECKFPGTWLDVTNNIHYNFVPLDPSGHSLSIIGTSAGGSTFGGLFPDAVNTTAYHGTARRVARNTYAFTLRRRVTDLNHEEVYTQVSSGETVFDCDTGVATFTTELFGPDGDLVLPCTPGVADFARLGMTEPCMP